METGFRLVVTPNPEHQQGIIEACEQGVTMSIYPIVCATTEEEIHEYCDQNGISLPVEEV